MVSQAERVQQHGLFYPSEQSFACNGCQFRDPCRAWHRNQAKIISLAA
jgi:hypothetical protein